MANRATWLHGARLACVTAVVCCVGCSAKPLPDPRVAAQRWAEAVRTGDENVMYSLLSTASRQTHGKQGVARLLAQHQRELLALAQGTASSKARLDKTAQVFYADDRSAREV